MSFPAILVAITLITLGLIFGVYKFFLNKPLPPAPSPAAQVINTFIPPQLNPQVSVKPSTVPIKSAPPSPTNNSVTLPKSTIGSVTVLQNNLATNQTGSSTISGLIDIAGTPQSGTSIVIVARKSGTNDPFQTVVNGVTAQDSQSWAWNGAQGGTNYDMVAVLKGTSSGVDIDYAKSQTYTVVAPAYSQIFIIDVGYIFGAPTGTITVTCNTHYSNNTWYATVNFPAVNNALKYWLKVGTTSAGSDIANIEKNAQSQDVTLNDSVNYYAQYSVSPVSNPTAYQYSAFSSSNQIRCP